MTDAAPAPLEATPPALSKEAFVGSSLGKGSSPSPEPSSLPPRRLDPLPGSTGRSSHDEVREADSSSSAVGANGHEASTAAPGSFSEDRRKTLSNPKSMKKLTGEKDADVDVSTSQQLKFLEHGPPFWNSNSGLINQKSNIMSHWDSWIFCLLVYTAVITPYEVAFIDSSTVTPMFVFNRLVDLSFVVDIYFNFHLPYLDIGGIEVHDRKRVRQHYIKGWLSIDVVSVLPFEIMSLFQDSANDFKVFRNTKCFRIAKLSRIVRGSRLFKRWEARVEINYRKLNMALLIVCLLCLSHWMACIWAVLLRLEGEAHLNDFCNTDQGYCSYPDLLEHPDEYHVRMDSNWERQPFRVYIMLLFWTFGMVVGSGYNIMIRTEIQRIFCLLFMVTAGICNALIIGNVVNYLEQMQQDSREFQDSMDHLNSFLREKRVNDPTKNFYLNEDLINGPSLCGKLREFYIFQHTQRIKMKQHNSIMKHTCPSLTEAVSSTLHMDEVKKIDFFRTSGAELIGFLSTSIESEIFCIHDRVYGQYDTADYLYIIAVTGSVFCDFQILTKGDAFGHRVFYATSSNSCYGHTATCLSNMLLHKISRPVLLKAMEKYGAMYKTKKGNMIPYLTMIRMYGNLLKIATNVRAAASQGIRYGYSAGVKVLVERYDRGTVMDPTSPLLELYSCYTKQLIKKGMEMARAGEFDVQSDGKKSPSQSLGLTDADLMRNPSVNGKKPKSEKQMKERQQMTEQFFKKCEEEFIQAELAKDVQMSDRDKKGIEQRRKFREMGKFLRSTDAQIAGVETQHIIKFERENLTLEHIVSMRPTEIAALTGMPTGDCIELLEVIEAYLRQNALRPSTSFHLTGQQADSAAPLLPSAGASSSSSDAADLHGVSGELDRIFTKYNMEYQDVVTVLNAVRSAPGPGGEGVAANT